MKLYEWGYGPAGMLLKDGRGRSDRHCGAEAPVEDAICKHDRIIDHCTMHHLMWLSEDLDKQGGKPAQSLGTRAPSWCKDSCVPTEAVQFFPPDFQTHYKDDSQQVVGLHDNDHGMKLHLCS